IAIIQDGQVVLEHGYGFRDRAHRLPVTPNTLFAIGSATKAFTNTALSMLREKGLIDFDQPIRKYLPDFRMSDEAVASQITLKDMLSHQSGLPRHDFLWYLTPFSRDQLFRKIAFLQLNPKMGFRQGFQYNNLM